VLIGSDGRVREAQVVRATIPISAATVKQALKAWRFTPAMRGRGGRGLADAGVRFNID
jgi:hypothetical protein